MGKLPNCVDLQWQTGEMRPEFCVKERSLHNGSVQKLYPQAITQMSRTLIFCVLREETIPAHTLRTHSLFFLAS